MTTSKTALSGATTLPAPDPESAPSSRAAQEEASALAIVEPGRYVAFGELGRGGIGRILKARDERLRRPVALKELLDPSLDAEARFAREALVTARLQHPSIVPVYDAGRWPSGEAFYAMKLVSGRSLDDVIAAATSFHERLSLLPHVIAVAEAIAYAHSEGIVHRDLKPANVLIGPFGETVVIDWGLAKDLREAQEDAPAPEGTKDPGGAPPATNGSASASGRGTLTMAGAVMGTPSFMAPEQARGESIDERADVYALGAILYHLLVGAPPYDGATGLAVLKKVLAGAPPPIEQRQAGVPRELLTITTKAMARELGDRYRTAKELAEDLRRFQTGQIVGAHHYSRIERLVRFARRNRAALAVAAAALLVTGGVATSSLSRVIEARRIAEIERDRANEERARAERKQAEAQEAERKTAERSNELIVTEARAAARRDPNAALGWLSSLGEPFQSWGEARLIAADAEAYGIAKVLAGHEAAISAGRYAPDGSVIATVSDDRTVGLWSPEGELLRRLEGHKDEVWGLDFSADSKRIATNSKDGTVRIWDIASGASRVIATSGPEIPWAVFARGDKAVALMSCAAKRIEIHDIETGAIEPLPGEITCPASFASSSDKSVIAYGADGKARVFDLKTGRFRDFESKEGACRFMSLAPDARYVACSGLRAFAAAWDVKTGRPIEMPGHRGSTTEFDIQITAFSPARPLMTWGELDGTVHVLDIKTGSARVFREHTSQVPALVFSQDGRWLATASGDRTVVLRDLEGGGHRTYYGFNDMVAFVSFSPDQTRMVASSWDHTARIFPFGISRDRTLVHGEGSVALASFSEDGGSLISAREGGSIRIDEIKTGSSSLVVAAKGARYAFSKDLSLVAFATEEGAIHVRRLREAEDLHALEGAPGRLQDLIISPKNDTIIAVGEDGSVRAWDLASRAGRTLVEPKKGVPAAAAFSSDGRRIAVGTFGAVLVFSVDGRATRTFEGHVGPVTNVAFFKDGRRLVSGGSDHTLRIWDIETGGARTIEASGVGISGVLLSKDEATLYSLGGEQAIRRWEVETGKPLPMLRGHSAMVIKLALSPDEGRLASADVNGVLRLWDLASGQSRTLEGHKGKITWLGFSPKGDMLASAGDDGTARIWHDDLPSDPAGLKAWLARAISPR